MEKNELRVVFMGTPEFAVRTLRALVENGYNVVAVVTQPDKPVGRHGSVLQPPAVKEYALQQGLPVLQPVRLKDEAFVETLRSYGANLQVVVAFRMLPEVVWAMPRLGTFNVHASLLPQYRGAAPINWAIINGESRTGVTTFFLDHEIDTGRIIMQQPFDIPADVDAEYVYDGLMNLGADVCLQTLERIVDADGRPESFAQPTAAAADLKPAPKIHKETCMIDWRQPARRVYDFVRGLSPYPGAWTTLTDEAGRQSVLKVFRTTMTTLAVGDLPPGSVVVEHRHFYVATADTLLQLDSLQLAGKKRMEAGAFLNGWNVTKKYSAG